MEISSIPFPCSDDASWPNLLSFFQDFDFAPQPAVKKQRTDDSYYVHSDSSVEEILNKFLPADREPPRTAAPAVEAEEEMKGNGKRGRESVDVVSTSDDSYAGGGGGGGGSEPSRGAGLTRFRSAPATWLEALLDSDTENDVVLDPPPILPSSSKPPPHPHSQPLPTPPAQLKQPSVGGSGSRYAADLGLFESGGGGGEAASGLSNFVRQNSSPAEFLSQISSDIFFPSFGAPPSFDYLSSSPMDVAQSAKRPREADSQSPSAKLSSPLKGEQSGRLRSAGGSLDAEMEKMMEDLVPCRVRAKRGCATHPRSIAERVRRTRISDRIRKLQELVPNMDKQTNTADMLEEAVEYVKFLQKQIQELTEHQKKCTCSTNEQ